MDVISPTFDTQDWLPGIIAFGLPMLIALIVAIVFTVEDKEVGTFFGASAFGLVISAFIALLAMAAHGPIHHDNMVADLEERFEDGYNLTIVDNTRWADIPLTPGDDTEAVKVFLHDIPGEQTILVEIVDGKYVVTHNGDVREPVN